MDSAHARARRSFLSLLFCSRPLPSPAPPPPHPTPPPPPQPRTHRTQFTKAVESKQVAQQDAERARFVVMRADQERKAAVIRAEGEAQSARLISDATRAAGGGLIELRRIEAAKEVAATMARSGNVVYLPGGNQMLLGLGAAGR